MNGLQYRMMNENVREKLDALKEAIENQFGQKVGAHFLMFLPEDTTQNVPLLESIYFGEADPKFTELARKNRREMCAQIWGCYAHWLSRLHHDGAL